MDTTTIILLIILGSIGLFITLALLAWFTNIGLGLYASVSGTPRALLGLFVALFMLALLGAFVFWWGFGVVSSIAAILLVLAAIGWPPFIRKALIVFALTTTVLTVVFSVVFALGAVVYFFIFHDVSLLFDTDNPDFWPAFEEFLLFLPLVTVLGCFVLATLFGGGGGGLAGRGRASEDADEKENLTAIRINEAPERFDGDILDSDRSNTGID